MGSDTEGGSALRADGGCFESAILAKPTVALIGLLSPKGIIESLGSVCFSISGMRTWGPLNSLHSDDLYLEDSHGVHEKPSQSRNVVLKSL